MNILWRMLSHIAVWPTHYTADSLPQKSGANCSASWSNWAWDKTAKTQRRTRSPSAT